MQPPSVELWIYPFPPPGPPSCTNVQQQSLQAHQVQWKCLITLGILGRTTGPNHAWDPCCLHRDNLAPFVQQHWDSFWESRNLPEKMYYCPYFWCQHGDPVSPWTKVTHSIGTLVTVVFEAQAVPSFPTSVSPTGTSRGSRQHSLWFPRSQVPSSFSKYPSLQGSSVDSWQAAAWRPLELETMLQLFIYLFIWHLSRACYLPSPVWVLDFQWWPVQAPASRVLTL